MGYPDVCDEGEILIDPSRLEDVEHVSKIYERRSLGNAGWESPGTGHAIPRAPSAITTRP